ncbi:DNA topoisomerase-3 [Pontibacter aydingkolensis]|uniref:DNA topoisomerase n=1 Tax=Pontibacter aydingkolensis TaxID=1911536 RepID=A0ABS7CW16_9BACT|nr:type IA DNA topoisomerase [Pontibacter aydingkolensis]MBW7468051.1 DNA topoisomerase 3 [Pontibacter aydingkolensis]
MKVCIAEKPSVAREIAMVIGAKTKKDGYYEGNGYQVTWTFGHFCTLREPDDYRPEWKRWSLYDLPMLPERYGIKLMKDAGVQKQFRIIQQLLDKAEEVINCGDAGQEGEVIQRWVLTEAKYKKPFKRLWISSLTEDAIRQGFAKLKPGSDFDSLYQAGKSRAIGDWLLGLNATRLFTLKYANGSRQTLSIGRVQTPTLAMIVNRHHEIANFVPQPFWELKTVYRDTTFSSTNGRFQKEEEAQKIMEAIKEAELTITDVETKKGTESSPKLFDLTSLQIECNNKLSLSADETLKTVQSLYEKKVVSYPRVDTTFLPDDIYPKIPGILQGLSNYRQEVEPLLQSKIRKTKKVFNNNKVTDHHAIIPTGAAAGGLYGREADVYDIITRRFLAAFYPDCIVSNTTVMAESAGYSFRVRGKQILEPGWRVLYGAEDVKADTTGKEGENKDEEEATGVLPHFDKGEHGPHAPLLDKKMTNPPKEYTEATLLRAMETAGKQVDNDELKEALKENGIGRPSTRAAIIETLFKRQYIRKEKKKIIPTQMGIDLIGVIRNQTLKSAEMTGQWERKLRQIEGGEFKAEDFLKELQDFVISLVQEVKYDKATVTLEPAQEEAKPAAAKKKATTATPKKEQTATKGLGYCPACKEGHILKGSKAFGCIRFKEGCRFLIPIEQQGKALTEKQVQALLSKGKTPVIKGFKNEQGESYDAILTLDAKMQPMLSKIEKAAETDPFAQCPRCKQGRLLKGKAAYGCSRFKEGCQLLVPFQKGGKELSDKQIAALLLKGKTPKIKGFISEKTGEPFDAALSFNEQWQVVYQF